MKQVWVRPANAGDLEKLVDWTVASLEASHFDPDILGKPSTLLLAAHDSQPITFLPLQMVLMLESVVSDPEASPERRALAIRELTKAAAYVARSKGVNELVFLPTDPELEKLAKKHGFEELPYKVMRLKLDSIENPNDKSQK
jgi:hypothetical protein